MSDHFVIMGPPRAGSTLLAHTLNVHPQVVCTDEARPFLSAHRAFRPLKARQSYQDEFWEELKPAFRMAVMDFYLAQAEKKNAESPYVWGDKFPHYCDPGWGAGILEVIDDLFPDMKYVFLTRTKAPVVKSMKKVNRNHNWLKKDAGEIYDEIHTEGDRWESIVGPDRFLRLHYEENLMNRVGKFLDFTGLQWNDLLKKKIEKEERDPTRYSTPTSW